MPYSDPDVRREYNRAWAAKNPEKIKASRQVWAAKNPEKIKANNQAWAAKNPDRKRALNRKHQQTMTEEQREIRRVQSRMRIFPSHTAASRTERSRKARLADPEKARARARRNQKTYRDRDPRGFKNRRLLRAFGITIDIWETMFAAQNYRCAVCGTSERGTKFDWHTDHCHVTRKVRGILCHHCNLALGGARDQPALLRSLADYLERHQ